jgi:hypothetical protein
MSKHAPKQSPRQLIVEVQSALNYLRKLLQGNSRILSKIDKAYEDTVLTELKLVPQQYDNEILDIIRIVKICISNINYGNIARGLGGLPNHIRAMLIPESVDTFGIFRKCIENIQMKPVDRARIINIVSKFRPLFQPVDELLKNPLDTVKKVSELTSVDDFADIDI